MKKNFFSALLLCAVVFLSSCGGDSAVRVNDVIVAKADKVTDLMRKVVNHIGNDDYDKATLYLDSVSIYIKESEPIITGLNNKSAEELKKITLEYIALFNDGVTDCKEAIQIYQSADDNEQLRKATALINNFIDKADKKLEEARKAQVDFAKANNISLR